MLNCFALAGISFCVFCFGLRLVPQVNAQLLTIKYAEISRWKGQKEKGVKVFIEYKARKYLSPKKVLSKIKNKNILTKR